MSGISPDSAELFAGLATCLFYGVNACLIGPTLLLLIRKARSIPHLWAVFTITLLQFGIITANVGVYARMLYEGFVLYRNEVDPTEYFADIAGGMSIARFVLFALATMFGDGLLIWRCFMVYNKALWVIIVASILFAANIVMGSYALNLVINLDPSRTLYILTLQEIMMSWYALEATFNVFISTLVALRIWSSIRATSSTTKSAYSHNHTPQTRTDKTLLRFLLVFLQSAALVPLSCIVTLALYGANNNAQMITLALIPHFLVGSPNAILLLSPSAFSSPRQTLDANTGWSSRASSSAPSSAVLALRSRESMGRARGRISDPFDVDEPRTPVSDRGQSFDETLKGTDNGVLGSVYEPSFQDKVSFPSAV